MKELTGRPLVPKNCTAHHFATEQQFSLLFYFYSEFLLLITLFFYLVIFNYHYSLIKGSIPQSILITVVIRTLSSELSTFNAILPYLSKATKHSV